MVMTSWAAQSKTSSPTRERPWPLTKKQAALALLRMAAVGSPFAMRIIRQSISGMAGAPVSGLMMRMLRAPSPCAGAACRAASHAALGNRNSGE